MDGGSSIIGSLLTGRHRRHDVHMARPDGASDFFILCSSKTLYRLDESGHYDMLGNYAGK